MPDVFTATTRTGFFGRIGNSFVGVLLGPILVIAAIWLLSWNEGRAVQAIEGLRAAQASLIESPLDPLPANEGKLVHVVGKAEASETIEDSDTGASFSGQVGVDRSVEMYQWKEKKEEHSQDNVGGSQTTTTTYSYSRVWSAEPIDSSDFKHPEGHENPQMPFQSKPLAATDAKLGGFALTEETLEKVGGTAALRPEAPDGWTASGGGLFKGENPQSPAIGDLRVHYMGLPTGTTISVLAKQSDGGFSSFTTSNGYTIHLARAGNAAADLMIADQRKAEAGLTWILRGVGAFVMWIGFALFFAPLAIIASIVPFLGSLVRGATSAFAFVLTVPVALITIALSWLAFRPLIGGGVLLLAAGFGYLLWRWHHGRTAHRVASQQTATATPAAATH